MTRVSNAEEVWFDGVRVRYRSTKPADELLTALLDDIGHTPVPINELAVDAQTWETYAARVQAFVGPSGFMLFALLDHGAWLPTAGIDRRVLRVILGNPLIAITMLRHDVTAGLFAPVEMLVTDDGAGSRLTYVRPSSLMVVEPNPELATAATQLDAKLAALAEKVTS